MTKLKNIDKVGTIAAVLIFVGLFLFPFINPCQYEDDPVCTWDAVNHGNGLGHSFTNFYGITIYHP